ncbi:TPA: beta-ketoacyl-[acyl-carrier-protein] synthase II [bacterium]|nr:beta-ketoacyl-[acyl-carrier-protein] synthase II [bacterium]
MKRRVVVTGVGAVTPVGVDVSSFWDSLLTGRSGVSRITRFSLEGYRSQIAAEIKDFDPSRFLDQKDQRHMARFTQFAYAAARMAIEDAGLDLKKEDPTKIGVLIGSGIGGLDVIEEEHKKLLEEGPRKITPFFIPKLITDIASGWVSISFGFKGPNSAVVTACASGAHAIGDAYRIIQRQEAEVMVTGGTEAAITPLALAGFSAARSLSTRNDDPERASRPFDRERDGFVVGEGAGIVILESKEHAVERGAHIYGEIVGYGMSGDAYHLTAPAPRGEGAARAIKAAIKDAGVAPEDVDYINAHGTSTPLNDKCETEAIKDVFKESAYKIPISSTKSMIGHLLGAAGGVEFIVTLLTIERGVIHPTINYESPDPECDLDYVPNSPREARVNVAISSSFGFGGHNAVLIAKRFIG